MMIHKHPDFEGLIEELTSQLTGFRQSDEPPVEFARRYVGLVEAFLNKAQKAEGRKYKG